MSAFRRQRSAGFTLVELLVVMGILSGFLLMLVRLVDGGLSIFGEGELGQALADRASRAQHVITRELGALRGAASGRDREVVDDRFVLQELPIGLPPRPERGASRVQVLRGSVRLLADRELSLIEAYLAAQVMRDEPGLAPEAAAQKVARLQQGHPLRGLGNVLLVPWRQEGADEAFLELRAAWLLPGQLVPSGPDDFVDPFRVPVPGLTELPGLLVYRITTPILQELLHVEFRCWAQSTRSWDDGGGALPNWDSARGGWLVDEQSGGEFALDRGAASADVPYDDVHPHGILVRCVVAQPASFAAEGLLAQPANADDDVLVLLAGDRFPGPVTGGFVKLRGEWLSYGERDGDVLRGVRRGQRRTKALDHPAGTRVHVGRTVEFVVPIAHQKDDWNG